MGTGKFPKKGKTLIKKAYLTALLVILIINTIIISDKKNTLLNKFEYIKTGSCVIESAVTPYQRIDVVENKDGGRRLYLDGQLILSQKGVSYYHEAMTHPIMFTHPNPVRVLIIGGSDGGVLQEVLKHSSVQQVDLVTADHKVISLSEDYFPHVSRGAFYDRRAKIIISDERAYLKEKKNSTYDIIIIDYPDPVNKRLGFFYTKQFYDLCASNLSADGMLITQTCSPFTQAKNVQILLNTLKESFPQAYPLKEWVPNLGIWSFVIASRKYSPLSLQPELIKNRIAERKVQTKHYYPQYHQTYFTFPEDWAVLFKQNVKTTFTDTHPFIIPFIGQRFNVFSHENRKVYNTYLFIINVVIFLYLLIFFWTERDAKKEPS